MPSIASITVKKKDGTTDIVYDALAGSGGDSSPAVWRQDTGNTSLPNGLRAALSLTTKWNGPKSARQAAFNYARPYATQDTTTTLYSAKDRVVITGLATMPQAIPQAEIEEAVYQACNLLAATLIKQAMSAGYAPT